MKKMMLTSALAGGFCHLISKKFGIRGLAGVVLAAGVLAVPTPLFAATIPPDSTAFIAVYEIDSSSSACPGLCTIVSSTGTPLNLASTTFSGADGTISGSGSTSAGTLRTYIESTGSIGGETDLGVQDTYTVHGSATGPFAVTTTLHVTGTAGGVPFASIYQALVSGQVNVTIGTLDINSLTVDPFNATSQAHMGLPIIIQPAAISVPIDLSVSYTVMVSVGDVFNIAYGMNSDTGLGIVDLSHTATISFSTPDGIFLTSLLGGEFGDVPTSATPLPAALPLFASGLGALGLLGWRRKRKAQAA